MSIKSIVHKSIRASAIARTVDAKDDNSVLVSTEGASTRYTIPKHVVDGFDRHEFSFESGEAGTREVQRGP
jgi:hypothetical protein